MHVYVGMSLQLNYIFCTFLHYNKGTSFFIHWKGYVLYYGCHKCEFVSFDQI